MAKDSSKDLKKEISRLRSEVRNLQETKKEINAFTGLVSGNYWTQTGMPWVSSEGRKAVLTEYFWQPIRGQPRRVDTNELRQFSQTSWVNSCVKTIIDEISSLDWDIVPKDGYEYEWVETQINQVKDFFEKPNKNDENFGALVRAFIKDILEIDAGVMVKVFDINSYDFNQLEPKSGAPMLKPMGQRNMTEIYIRDGASFLKEIDKFGFNRGYWQYSYQIPAHPMWFNRDEIVYVSEQTRSMSCYGYARTQAILDLIKSLHYSTLYNKRFFEETPIPDGALSLLDTNETEMATFMQYWNNEFKAQPHKLAVINKDVKWQPFNITNRELEFLETQKWYYNLVITSFGLTPAEMGITDDVNRATGATQSELVKRKSIRPFLKLLEGAINSGIMPEFGFQGIEFQFIYDDPAEKNQRLSNWQMELSMGVKTVNEVRNEMGLEPIPGGDKSTNMGLNYASGMMGGSYQDEEEQADEGQTGNFDEQRKTEEGKPQDKKDNFKKEQKPKKWIRGKNGQSIPIFDNASNGGDKKDSEEPEEEKPEDKEGKEKPESGDNDSIGNAQQQEEEEVPEKKVNDSEIKKIAAEVLGTIQEADNIGTSRGMCKPISEAISQHLTSVGIENQVSTITRFTEEEGFSTGGHVAVYVPDMDIVIDTQLWQYGIGKRDDIGKRQIIYTKHDYEKLGMTVDIIPQNQDKTTNDIKPPSPEDEDPEETQDSPSVSNKEPEQEQTEEQETEEDNKEKSVKQPTKEDEEAEIRNSVMHPFSDANRPVGSFKGRREDLMGNSGFDSEMVRIGMEQERREHPEMPDEIIQQLVLDHLKLDPNEYADANMQKGIDNGQYYNDNPKQRYQRPPPWQPKKTDYQDPSHSDILPAPLGSDQRGLRDNYSTYENKDMIHCPMCGGATLATLDSLEVAEETMEEAIRCTQCGASFKESDLINSKVMEEMYNVVNASNSVEPVSYPSWSPKNYEFDKEADLDLDCKEYVGFDIGKSFGHSVEYAKSKAYKKLLAKYLSDLTEDQREKVIAIITNSMKSNLSVKATAEKLNSIVKDKERSKLIARTETIRVANEGNIMRMEERGADRAEWISAPEDGRRCEECAKRNGKQFSLKEIKGKIPLHPRCRCTTTEVFD